MHLRILLTSALHFGHSFTLLALHISSLLMFRLPPVHASIGVVYIPFDNFIPPCPRPKKRKKKRIQKFKLRVGGSLQKGRSAQGPTIYTFAQGGWDPQKVYIPTSVRGEGAEAPPRFLSNRISTSTLLRDSKHPLVASLPRLVTCSCRSHTTWPRLIPCKQS